jgi:hypothetical protein
MMSDPQVRLAALSKLVEIKSPAVEARLSETFRNAEGVLQHSTDYDDLLHELKTIAVLVPRFHMATMPLLQAFVRSVSTRALTKDGSPVEGGRLRYWSPANLIGEAIDVSEKVRYLHTEQVVDFLLEMSRSDDEDVRGKAERAFGKLAQFDLDIFYGEPGLGAQPQARMVSHFAQMKDEALQADATTILGVLSKVLSPSMEGTSWAYDSLMIRRGSIASAGGVADMRRDAINLVKRIFALDASVEQRRRALQALDSATRREAGDRDAETDAMFEGDALTVLEFMRSLVPTEPLVLVQAIEHQAYWDYYHAGSDAIRAKALEVRDALNTHAEYQIYKQLIGFEGIFGDWELLSRSDAAWNYSDTERLAAARKYLSEITEETYSTWRDRILEFSKTRSNDMAMFPVYYEFLRSIGQERPDLALELTTSHVEVMSPFLIPLMRGLWTSARSAQAGAIIDGWIDEGVHLSAIAKSLYGDGGPRLEVLRKVVVRASAVGDRATLIEVMGVASNIFASGTFEAKAIFMQSMRELEKHGDARWANVIWYSRDFKVLVGGADTAERAEMLASVGSLRQLDYQAEDVIFEIGKNDVQVVIDFLLSRLKRARELDRERQADDGLQDRFEAVPYQLTKLKDLLSKAPEALVEALRRDFDEEVRPLFSYRGARLLKAALTKFDERLETLLMAYVSTADEDDIDFVISILQLYSGASEIQGVCKAIVKLVPERSRTWNALAAAIESTGLVSGEYGLAHAYERKQSEISAWVDDPDEKVKAFALWLGENLSRMVEHERQRADEDLALRKYRHGVRPDEA